MPDDGGLTTLIATPTNETRYLFNNASWLRKTLSDELSTHAKLIVDLPSLHPDDVRTINPLGPATFCDSLILVCVRGRSTRQHLIRTVEQLRLAQVNLVGTVFNDYGYTSPGEEMARTARRYWWATPGFSRRLARTALNSELLR